MFLRLSSVVFALAHKCESAFQLGRQIRRFSCNLNWLVRDAPKPMIQFVRLRLYHPTFALDWHSFSSPPLSGGRGLPQETGDIFPAFQHSGFGFSFRHRHKPVRMHANREPVLYVGHARTIHSDRPSVNSSGCESCTRCSGHPHPDRKDLYFATIPSRSSSQTRSNNATPERSTWSAL